MVEGGRVEDRGAAQRGLEVAGGIEPRGGDTWQLVGNYQDDTPSPLRSPGWLVSNTTMRNGLARYEKEANEVGEVLEWIS